jgi:hypothetical protein
MYITKAFEPGTGTNLNFKLQCDTGQDVILRWKTRGTINGRKEEEASLLAERGVTRYTTWINNKQIRRKWAR